MDGLLFDSERLERDACRLVAAERGVGPIEDEFYLQAVGRNGADTKLLFLEKYGTNFPYDGFRAAWRARRDELVARDGLPMKAGASELIEHLRARRMPLALATSTGRVRATEMLSRAGLFDRFDGFAFGDEVTRGKPDPEIFLKAAGELGVAARDCLVLEDSDAGIAGAHAAGMTVIAVPDLKPISERSSAMVKAVCRSLIEVREQHLTG